MPDASHAVGLTAEELLWRYDYHRHHVAVELQGEISEGRAARKALHAYGALVGLRPGESMRLLAPEEEAAAEKLLDAYGTLVRENAFVQGLVLGAVLQAGETPDYEEVIAHCSDALTPTARAVVEELEGRSSTWSCPGCKKAIEEFARLPRANRLAQLDEEIDAIELSGLSLSDREKGALRRLVGDEGLTPGNALGRVLFLWERDLRPEDFGHEE